jgi:hypothetical protein
LSKEAFEGLLWTIHTYEYYYERLISLLINKSVQKNTNAKILDDFIQNMFQVEEFPDLWYFLCRNWRNYINEKDGDTESVNSLYYSRYIIAFILKSMVLSFHSKGLLSILVVYLFIYCCYISLLIYLNVVFFLKIYF